MKSILLLMQVLLSIIIITIGCNNVSKPSDLDLTIGIFEIIAGIVLLYQPARTLIKQL